MTSDHTQNTPDDALVRVARIGKPHGIKGDVTVQLFTDAPEDRFAPGAVLQARPAAGATPPAGLTVARARWNKEILLVGFQESPDRNTAETLRGTELFAAPDEEQDDDAWYEEDLVDLAVTVDGRRIGRVIALITGEVQDLLEIELDAEHGGHEALVPFVEEIVPEVDAEQGTIVLTPPPGLLRLNVAEDEQTQSAAGEPS